MQPLRKGPYQIIAKPTDVTYKITDSDKKEIVQHRNNLLPYYPKEYALRELTQFYSFTSLKVIQNHPHMENEINEQNDIHLEKQNKKPTTTKNSTKKLDQKTHQKEKKNRKMIEKIIPQEQVEKSEHRESSRLRNHHDLEFHNIFIILNIDNMQMYKEGNHIIRLSNNPFSSFS